MASVCCCLLSVGLLLLWLLCKSRECNSAAAYVWVVLLHHVQAPQTRLHLQGSLALRGTNYGGADSHNGRSTTTKKHFKLYLSSASILQNARTDLGITRLFSEFGVTAALMTVATGRAAVCQPGSGHPLNTTRIATIPAMFTSAFDSARHQSPGHAESAVFNQVG